MHSEPAPDSGASSSILRESGFFPSARAARRGARSSAIERLALAPSAFVALIGERGSGRAHFARELASQTDPGARFVLLDPHTSAERLRALAFELKPLDSSRAFALHVREIGAVSEAFQRELAVLCRALRDANRMVRITLGSAAPLADGARQGWLRPDLGYHFAAQVELPPLRTRPEDIAELVALLSQKASERLAREVPMFSRRALEQLCAHDWPENVAELERVIERAVATVRGDLVEAEDLPQFEAVAHRTTFQLPTEGLSWAELERRVLVLALERASNNQSRAAALIGLSRDQLRYRLAKFGLCAR